MFTPDDIIRANPEFEKADPCYVSIYLVERCYGGPEEGGWWYDCRTLEGGVPFASEREAEKYLQSVLAEVERRNREEQQEVHALAFESLPDTEEYCPAGYDEGYIPRSWSDGGEYEVVIENALGVSDNSREGAPHYE